MTEPRRLVQSFRALWSEDVKREGTSRVTWEIEPVGDSCRPTVTHDQLREDANDELYGGRPMIAIPARSHGRTPNSIFLEAAATSDGA